MQVRPSEFRVTSVVECVFAVGRAETGVRDEHWRLNIECHHHHILIVIGCCFVLLDIALVEVQWGSILSIVVGTALIELLSIVIGGVVVLTGVLLAVGRGNEIGRVLGSQELQNDMARLTEAFDLHLDDISDVKVLPQLFD